MALDQRMMASIAVNEATGCWEWQKGKHSRCNYGLVSVSGKTRQAHRVMYELRVGPIPEGLCVLHRCDNPPCINPDHLFLGTNAANTADMFAKGRAPVGDRHWSRTRPERLARGGRHGSRTRPDCVLRGEQGTGAKLTARQVAEIRAKHAAGSTGRALAREFGISTSSISSIVRGETWK